MGRKENNEDMGVGEITCSSPVCNFKNNET